MTYQYHAEPMPENPANNIGDKSGKYQVREYEIAGSIKGKKDSRIVDNNLRR
ncbi:MAG: hypothetical protein M3388_05010 [Acidobacteriota bacterium]|nr:hypothetical protein [Acidobacteriota bacterium]